MDNKDKIMQAMKLIEEVIADTQTDAFAGKSENNERLQGVIRTFGSQFIKQLSPLVKWILSSD